MSSEQHMAATPAAARYSPVRAFIGRYSPLFIFAGLSLVLMALSPDFRRMDNLQNVAYRSCALSLMAIGQTLVILTAGIDLSVGSVAALAGVVAGKLMVEHQASVAVSIVAGTLTGGICGLICGLLWTKGKLPPFIASLGMMMAARGAAMLLADAQPIYGLPESFRWLGGMRGWWAPVLITTGFAILIAGALTFTRFGRAVFATGGNARAARLSGIPVGRVRTAAFTINGLLVGFAGVMLASYVGIADPSAAEGAELDAIAACVIGGASLMGGEGSSLGALAGGLIMKVLDNFCTLKGIDPHWQKLIVGGLIVLLVLYDTWRKRRAGLIQE